MVWFGEDCGANANNVWFHICNIKLCCYWKFNLFGKGYHRLGIKGCLRWCAHQEVQIMSQGWPGKSCRDQVHNATTRDSTVSLLWISPSIGNHLDCIYGTNTILMTITIGNTLQYSKIELGPLSYGLTGTFNCSWQWRGWTQRWCMGNFSVLGVWLQLCSSGGI